mmetsp:Transcript_7631/g.19090  ORF Transcript_7631/g.19090 Transcript_7631/m.19090 type:complete len:397 (+) Transcript_7631:27-1217(+)
MLAASALLPAAAAGSRLAPGLWRGAAWDGAGRIRCAGVGARGLSSDAAAGNKRGLEVPVIDISSLVAKQGDITPETPAVRLIADACRKWGFFQAVNHAVPEDVMERLDREQRAFFARESEWKRRIKRTEQNSRGFFDDELTKQTRDFKEGFDFGAQDGDLAGRSVVDGYNQWPEGEEGFRRACEDYYNHLTGLSRVLLGAMSVGMGQPRGFFDWQFKAHSSFLRLNYYPVCPNPVGADFPVRSPGEQEGVLGVNRHADAGLVTILRQRHDEPHSLQVYKSTRLSGRLVDHDDEEGEWVTVEPVPGAFTINIGDMMQVYSNDKYVAPLHRVLGNSSQTRFSAPYFFNPPYEANCAPVDSLGSPVFQPVNWGKFRHARFAGDYADVGPEVQISAYRVV